MKTEIRYFVICNPASGNGAAGKNWKKTKALLEQYFLFDSAITEYPRHAEKLVGHAIEQGFTHIIAVGGDGLLQEVANGVLTQKIIDPIKVKVALLSQGTGNDWRKSSLLPKNQIKAIEAIQRGKTILQDVGLVSFFKEGVKQQRYCINFAGVGFDSYVVANTLALKKYGAVAYLLGMSKCLFSYNKPILKISSAEKTITAKAYLCIAGIGKFGGGGMKLMPDADMTDGLFDISFATDLSPLEVIINLPKLYSGELTKLKKVITWTTSKLAIEVVETTQNVLLEADGEIFGEGPFEIEIVPAALQVVVG